MSVVKSFSVGNGDMFYVEHNSDNFTIIDCSISEDDGTLDELAALSNSKGVTRFISTHPDDDHIGGLDLLDDRIGIRNFYCVKNAATKEDATDCFTRYCELRNSDKAFYIFKDCQRRWMNLSNEERQTSGINILWPDVDSQEYKDALAAAEAGESPNNISPIVRYAVTNGGSFVWMGDLETEFMESIEDQLALEHVDILFAPHHGRDSGKVPAGLLDMLTPRIIVIGEAPSEHLNYYAGYNTITQNLAGDIVFECETGKVHIFTSNVYDVDFLEDEGRTRSGYHYVGTLKVA